MWRQQNLDKLATHGISRSDVEEVIAVDAWVATSHPDYPDQVRVIGPARRGRLLTVVLEPTAAPDAWRPVTGWASSTAEVAYYSEETQG